MLTVLERIKNQGANFKHLPKVYVMGSTNCGKSSLINSMLLLQSKYNKNKKSIPPPLLTESAVPGTTQEMLTVEEFRLGLRVIDTPGIPNMNQVSSLIE